jgi:hypothetical protein
MAVRLSEDMWLALTILSAFSDRSFPMQAFGRDQIGVQVSGTPKADT